MIEITSFYRFNPLTPPIQNNMVHELEGLAKRRSLRGLVLIGPEGINSTCSGEKEAIEELKALVRTIGVEEFKDSRAEKHPFNFFRVKVKDEIVTIGQPGLMPDSTRNFHMTPAEWHEAMNDPDTIVLDTRNDYEIYIGKFQNALDFRMQEFSEFPEALSKSGIDKNKRVLMYCTGGIRCEKAILEANKQGFENVFQLQGGILSYLEKYPGQKFEGECFVFDYRVAVDQNLNPTKKYDLCPHCGQPSNQKVTCAQCGSEAELCPRCISSGADTCSKNCAHHRRIGSRSSKPQKVR